MEFYYYDGAASNGLPWFPNIFKGKKGATGNYPGGPRGGKNPGKILLLFSDLSEEEFNCESLANPLADRGWLSKVFVEVGFVGFLKITTKRLKNNHLLK